LFWKVKKKPLLKGGEGEGEGEGEDTTDEVRKT
jgi:hypothetical protein